MNKQLSAYAIFTGGMIGVGVFGIPFALVNAGSIPTIVIGLIVLSVTYAIHLFLVEIVINTKGRRQLPGYVGAYLGKKGKMACSVANIFGSLGALLAYLIAGSSFLVLFLSPVIDVHPLLALLVYFILGAGLMFRGANGLPIAHLSIMALFGSVLLYLGITFGSQIDFSNIPFYSSGLVSRYLLPYGVLIFAFWGLSLVPELVSVSGGNRKIIHRALLSGFGTAFISYVIFSVIIAGISGAATSENAINGLLAVKLKMGAVYFASLFGVLTTFSSFLAVGHTLKRTLIFDYRFSDFGAWVVAMGSPLILYLLGVQGFVKVLGITGAMFIGLEGILVVATFRKMKGKSIGVGLSKVLLFSIVFLLFAGIIAEVSRVLNII